MSEAVVSSAPVRRRARAPRSLMGAMMRGMRLRCPSCGIGAMFRKYLKVNDSCPHCEEALHHHRADDAPPYFTIMIVGHVIVPGLLVMERLAAPSMWVHAAVWLPLTVILALACLPLTKGALVGLQWALYMHGFDPKGDAHAVPHQA